MATRRFCDKCDRLLGDIDDQPFIRTIQLKDGRKVSAHVMMVNDQAHVVTDICNDCKISIVTDGAETDQRDFVSPQVATLQPSSAMTGGESAPVIEKKTVPFERSKKSK